MICTVVVVYNPDLELLDRCLLSLEGQVGRVYIVSNGGFSRLSDDLVSVTCLPINMGIAYALNYGMALAKKDGFKYIHISDQDTIYPDCFFEKMLSTFDTNVIAIAPAFYDSVSRRKIPFYVDSYFGFKKKEVFSGFVNISQAISSGLIIKSDLLDVVGGFDEDLFIDWVDFEWCWRATAKGFKLIGVADVIINHHLGDETKNIYIRTIGLRSPIRHYYITRNAVYLSIYSRNLDFLNRVNLFLKSFIYILGYPLLSKPHSKNLKAVLIGFWHGVTKRLGKYDL